MKNIVLLAAIGAALNLGTSLFWLAVNLAGPEAFSSVIRPMQLISGLVGVLAGGSILSFFVALYMRQK